MKRVFGSLFLKMLAFVTACILTPILFFSFTLFQESYNDNMYLGESKGYENTSDALSFVCGNLAEIREYIYWNDISGLKESEFYKDHRNFFYTVYDEKGNEVYTTLPENTKVYMPEERVKKGVIRVYDGYPAREVSNEGKPLKEYSIAGYIRMPLDPTEDGYESYMAYQFRLENHESFLTWMIVSFIICAVLTLYLIAGAGRDTEGSLALKGLNAIDYDLAAFIYIIVFSILISFAVDLPNGFEVNYLNKAVNAGAALIIVGITAATLAFLMNLSAHFKMEKWWRYSIIWRCCSLIKRFVVFVFSGLDVAWKLAFLVAFWGVGLYLYGLFTTLRSGLFCFFLGLLWGIAGVVLSIWIGIQLNALKKGGEAIARGDLEYRVNAKELWPTFRCHAFNLNSAAMGMSKAVEGKMKSERFKTELITNVSHDLKTPLTVIVSYVDLLKKEEIENEQAKEYVETIERQAAKLKKLTEDLVEASKASSGTITVNRERFNIGELVIQSVGEFSEKFQSADIVPIVNIPEEEIAVFTDGRLLWRVFDNLIQNIIKYAQPGTRAYFDLTRTEKEAVLEIKNISKEPLNMSAEALMERFVRGDESRGSEGNGLGLSIAKSLTEVCGGKFELKLDGDLYKVEIVIPTV